MTNKISQTKAVYCFTSVKELTTVMLFNTYPTVTNFYEISGLETNHPTMVHYVAMLKDKHGSLRVETHELVKRKVIDLSLLDSTVTQALNNKKYEIERRAAEVLVPDTKNLSLNKGKKQKSLHLHQEITDKVLYQDLGGRSFDAAYLLQSLSYLDNIYVYKSEPAFQGELAHLIQAYQDFMFDHMRRIFETLDISVSQNFYKNFFTDKSFVTRDALLYTSGEKGEVIGKAIQVMAGIIATYSSMTQEVVQKKLSNSENMAKLEALLPEPDAIRILQLLYKLHELMQLDGLEWPEAGIYTGPLHEKLIHNDFFTLYNRQPFGVYIRHAIQGKKEITLSQLPNQGTIEEQDALAQLKTYSANYLAHLKNLIPTEKILTTRPTGELDYDDDVVTSVSERRLFEKYNTVLSLSKTLLEEHLDVPARLANFRREFISGRSSIAAHRDNAGLRWLRNVAYVLGTLGIGLIPSIRNREFSLFPSEGNKFNQRIDQQLDQLPAFSA